ncbi:hypothetical protein [Herbaspirillum autotrophicum]|uniref:hypothetical protein n=1 Tax=Herbaspirillum autotrophicum TaxID=180195 RepID=UPI0018DE16A4|nr:hypothetical protein [Herbaspirillum autotrophicum]
MKRPVFVTDHFQQVHVFASSPVVGGDNPKSASAVFCSARYPDATSIHSHTSSFPAREISIYVDFCRVFIPASTASPAGMETPARGERSGVLANNKTLVSRFGGNVGRQVLFEKILMLAVSLHLDNQYIGANDVFQASALRVWSKE